MPLELLGLMYMRHAGWDLKTVVQGVSRSGSMSTPIRILEPLWIPGQTRLKRFTTTDGKVLSVIAVSSDPDTPSGVVVNVDSGS